MTQSLAASALATLPPVALVDRKAFADAMARAVKTVEKRNTIPILSNVRLAGNGSSLLIEATDLDVYSSFTIAGAVDSRFAVTIPAHMLRDVLKKASSEYVELAPWSTRAPDSAGVTVDFEGAKASLQSLPVYDFPCLVAAAPVACFTMPAATLRRMLEAVTVAISTEETRYYLNGIYLHLANGATKDAAKLFRAVATDGHRMLSATLAEIPAGAENMPSMIVPRKTCALLLAELKRKGAAASVEIQASETQICFTIGAAVIRSKLIDGTFPDYARITPAATGYDGEKVAVATIDADKLAGLVASVSQVSASKGGAQVQFDFAAGALQATVNNPDSGSASQSIACDYDGEPLTIGFNGRYVCELLEAVGADSLRVTLRDPGFPIRIVPVAPLADGVDVLAVLMPMRV